MYKQNEKKTENKSK